MRIGLPCPISAQSTLEATILEQNINPVPEGEAIIALNINRVRYGDVEARIEMEDPFIKVALLREVLAPAFSEAQMERIFTGILSRLEWAGMADLEAAGILGQWDMETLSYSITTPGEYSSLTELDFSPQIPTTETNFLKPSPLAGVVNFNITGTANFSEAGMALPLAVNANALLNLFSVAIESSGSVSYTEPSWSWYFSDAKAVYDLPSIEGRINAGMVGGEGIDYQSRPELYGISLRNLENFSRYDRNYSPSMAFTLQNPSRVRIKINGNVVKVINLGMGNYRYYDLPFSYGLNDFELEVEESASSEGILVYRPAKKYVTVETGLLVGGKTDYGFSAGVGRSEPDQPFISAYLRHGLQSYLTVQGNVQADLRSALTGIGFVSGTDIGGFIFNAAALTAWDNRDDHFAYSTDLDYNFAIPAKPQASDFGVSIGYASRGFSAPQPISSVTIPEAHFTASGHFGGSFAKSASYGFSGQWKRVFSTPRADTAAFALNFGFALSKNAAMSVGSGVSFATGETPDFSLNFSLSASDPRKPGRQVSYSQPNDGTTSISFNDQLPVMGGIGYGINISNPIGGVSKYSSLAFSSGFDTQLFTLSGSGGMSYGGPLSSPNGSLAVTMGTAVSFAGSSFALSKPLHDSFVVFDPDKTTGKMPVAFAVDAGTRLMSHGIPVAAPLGSYRKQRLSMDFPEADADVSATIPYIAVSPGYRSGFLFKAGLERRFYATGYLVDSAGSPITLVAGDILQADGSLMDQTFTDDSGMFQLFGLTNGKYSIAWPENVGVSVLNLNDDGDGLLELGEITATPEAGR
ncbi:MAG: fimbria/pilus outer membrane usher protein [Rectinemataceae bacterium]|nr:fimbria/pilus outer membrane usher protein [Rectinemataceae bacterium]